jgi:mono/diheme cytochrome c family protein
MITVAVLNALVATIVLGVTLTGCDLVPGRAGAREPRGGVPAPATAFHTLYDQQCAGCHGRDGRFGAARPLNDPVYLALVPAERIRQVIADGVPGTAQPAHGREAGGALTDEQIELLVQGLRTAWSRPDALRADNIPPYASPLGDQERGRAVYAAACASCHGPGGAVGPQARSVVDASYLALVSDQHLRTTVIAGRSDLGMPDWRAQIAGRALSPGDVSDVVAWLATKRTPVPGRPGGL